MTLKDFKSLIVEHKKNNKRFTFLPEFFKDIVFRRSDENDVKYKFGDIQVFFNKVCNGEMKDLPYDVIVTTDLDNRNWGGIIRIPSLVYKEFIMDYIKKDENYNFLMNNKFITVHLRGTDRSSFTEDYRPDLTNFSHHTWSVQSTTNVLPDFFTYKSDHNRCSILSPNPEKPLINKNFILFKISYLFK